MKKTPITPYLLIAYLLIIILLQHNLTLTTTTLTITPLILIAAALYYQHKTLGFCSIILFYLLTLTQITLTTMESILPLILILILLLIPSIILLAFILQIGNQNTPLTQLLQTKPLLIATLIFICIMIIFYAFTLTSLNVFFLSAESTQGQILFLTAVSLLFTTPLLIKET